jgi:hypothetical protein
MPRALPAAIGAFFPGTMLATLLVSLGSQLVQLSGLCGVGRQRIGAIAQGGATQGLDRASDAHARRGAAGRQMRGVQQLDLSQPARVAVRVADAFDPFVYFFLA